MEGFRSLKGDELVQIGDLVLDMDEGAYYQIEDGTYHKLMVGITAEKVKTWSGVDDILRADT